jgi:predicted amidophosphoribosyltransferase
MGEYTARAGFSHSATNNLIHNLKKPMDRRGTPQWRWKEYAIREAAAALNFAFGDATLAGITFVPVPPSKVRSDPMYDDRMVQVLGRVRPGLDVRELVVQRGSRAAAHETDRRARPEEMVAQYQVVEALATPAPAMIGICDDMVTTGCQYRAMRTVLAQRFPQAEFFGLFLARRVPQAIEFGPVIDD